jgi:hypothetical protein
MSDELDERIAALLNEGAPPKSDPVFRIKVLERRERQRFQRKSISLAAFVAALLASIGAARGVGANLAEVAAVVLLCVSLGALVVYAPVVTRILRRHARTGGPLRNS